MRVKEIVVEASWGDKAKDKAKQAVNFGLRVGDALMGVSPTQGFDIKKGQSKRHVKQYGDKFFEAWVTKVQNMYETDSNIEKIELNSELDNIIEDIFKINPEGWELKELKDKTVYFTLEEIANTKGKLKNNSKVYKSILQLTAGILKRILEKDKPEKNARMVIITHGTNKMYYFSFKGALNDYSEYKQSGSDRDLFHKRIEVTDSIIIRQIKDKSDDNVERKYVVIKDESDGRKEDIRVLGT